MAPRKKKTQPVTDLVPGQSPVLVIQPPTHEQITKALDAAKLAVKELDDLAQALVISDQPSYTQADVLLNRIMGGERVVDDRFQPIITPLREPLDVIYGLKRDIIKPLAATKLVVKEKMGVYQLQEKRRLDEVEARNTAEAKRITDQWLRDNPPAPPVLVPLTPHSEPFAMPICQPQELTKSLAQPPVQITFLAPPPAPAPIAAHSSARFEKRFRTTDLDLLVDAAMSGILPIDILTVRPTALQSYFEADPVAFAQWPGVEVYDHPIITGR